MRKQIIILGIGKCFSKTLWLRRMEASNLSQAGKPASRYQLFPADISVDSFVYPVMPRPGVQLTFYQQGIHSPYFIRADDSNTLH